MTAAAKIGPILELLDRQYPDAHVTLDFTNPLEMLVATVLSAQCTDVRVNQVTPALFAKYRSAADYAKAPLAELEEVIRPTGFFHNKAKSIKAAATALVTGFPRGFPGRMEDLLTLPGVGRKTANVVLATCFGAPAIIVDTHVRRVAQRLGLASSDDPDEIERELQSLIPEKDWTAFSHAATFHGRRRCAARKPDHAGCVVRALCDSRDI